jgi:hypothetical protein
MKTVKCLYIRSSDVYWPIRVIVKRLAGTDCLPELRSSRLNAGPGKVHFRGAFGEFEVLHPCNALGQRQKPIQPSVFFDDSIWEIRTWPTSPCWVRSSPDSGRIRCFHRADWSGPMFSHSWGILACPGLRDYCLTRLSRQSLTEHHNRGCRGLHSNCDMIGYFCLQSRLREQWH